MKFRDIKVGKYVQLKIDSPSAVQTQHRAGEVIEPGIPAWPEGRVRRLLMRGQAVALSDKDGVAAMKLGTITPRDDGAMVELQKTHDELLAAFEELKARYLALQAAGVGQGLKELQEQHDALLAANTALVEAHDKLKAELADCQVKLVEAVNAAKKATK